MSAPPLVYDGLEFKERETLVRYAALKKRFGISAFVSLATLAPAIVVLLSSLISPGSYPSYLYLVFLAVSTPFSLISYRANSRLTEIINSNDVRHVSFPQS